MQLARSKVITALALLLYEHACRVGYRSTVCNPASRSNKGSSCAEKVDTVLGDRQPTMEDIQALRFTTRVLNESMRLYPQPPVLIRRALADDTVGGYKVRGPPSQITPQAATQAVQQAAVAQ